MYNDLDALARFISVYIGYSLVDKADYSLENMFEIQDLVEEAKVKWDGGMRMGDLSLQPYLEATDYTGRLDSFNFILKDE